MEIQIMRWAICRSVPENSFDYFEKTLITENGFREYDLRWVLGREINPNGFVVLGQAYGTYAQKELGEKKVIVGHDFRSYSQDVSRSLIVGLLSSGIHVIDVGLALTPMVYYAQHHFGVKAAAMVTASHNENGWTGIKLANDLSSTLGPAEIQRIKAVVEGGQFNKGNGSYDSFDGLFEAYCRDLIGSEKLTKPIRLVIACGNGTGGRFAPEMLRRFGCDVVELDCNPDWNFSKFNPNPEDIKFLESISHRTIEAKAQIGIGIDGDGDRIGIVDDLGREIYSDKLGLLLAHWICRKVPGRSFVVDVKSTGLFLKDPLLKKNGNEVVLWKTGHSYIKSKVAEIDAIAGFEKSGHWFFNHPLGRGYDDALLSCIRLLQMLQETGISLSTLVNGLPLTYQSPTLGAYCPDNVKYQVVEEVTEQYKKDKQNNIEIGGSKIKSLITINGIRFVLEDDSWGLVRASSNKPSLVIVAESLKSDAQLREIIKHIQSRLAETGQVGEYDQQMPD
jgi:phosphomannomutase / phosphoglucomutase